MRVATLLGVLLFSLAHLATLAAEEPSDGLAQIVLRKAGIRVGLCEMPRVGGGALAAALARSGIAQVHGMAPDAQAAETAREASAACGVLGSQVVVETGKPATLPLADWVADLLLIRYNLADVGNLIELMEIPLGMMTTC